MGSARRWDGDVRGAGVGAASGAGPGLRELLDLCSRPEWVAEEPAVHLEGHLREAAQSVGVEITATRTTDGGIFRVDLVHDAAMSRRAVRVAVWRLVAAIAETTTHVREVSRPERTEFHVVTGMPDGVGPFAAHGHHVVLSATPIT